MPDRGNRAGGPGGGRPANSRTSQNPRETSRSPNTRTTTQDPIDIATGEVLLAQVDVQLPGVLPLLIERVHQSNYRHGRLFGASWASTLDQRLEVDATGVHLVTADGMILTYPSASLPNVLFLPLEGPRWPLQLTAEGGYTVTDPQSGRVLHFPPPGPETGWSELPLTAFSDGNGNRVDFLRTAGTLTEIRHSGGYRIAVDTVPLDAAGPGSVPAESERRVSALRLLTGASDGEVSDGQVLARYGYDEAGHLAEVSGPAGVPLRFTYDGEGRMTSWCDRNGHPYEFEYDRYGRAVGGRSPSGFLNTSLTFQDDGRTVVTDSLGRARTYSFNGAHQLVAETDPLGNTTRYEWDRYDRLLSRTDALGATTRFVHDEHGSPTSIVRPDGARTDLVYGDRPHRPTEIRQPDGAVWRQTYDERGNLAAVTDPAGAVTAYAYDEHGGLASVTDPLGNVTRTVNDAAGLPLRTTGPLGDTTVTERDAHGRPFQITDPAGGITRLEWTPDGRLVARVLPDGSTERWAYDAEGNQTEHVDALGQATRTAYGPFGMPTAQTGPDGGLLRFAHDTELRLTTVTNPQGLQWTYRYDAAGNLVGETDFNGRDLAYTCDAAGRLVERNGGGAPVSFRRDVLGNVVERRSGEQVTTFAYDAAGRLARAVNADSDLRFERDALGRVTAEICNGAALTTAYDAAGQRVRRRTPSGAESTWSYDSAGQPQMLSAGGQTLRFSYDAAGREVQRQIGAGAVLAQQWDSGHRLSAQTVWGAPRAEGEQARLLQHRTYAYRPDGAVVGVGDRLAGDRRYDLDAGGRAVAVRAHAWTERYAYDLAGNLTQAAWPAGGPGDTAADAVGEREYAGTLIRRAGNVRYEHDPHGRVVLRQHARLSSKPLTWRYEWDDDDRLVGAATPDGARWRYRYDALGRRVSKQRLTRDGGVEEQTDFVWDGPVLAEQVHRVWSSDQRTYVASGKVWEYEPDTFRPISQTERAPARDAPQSWIDRQFYAIVTDLVGAPRELVDGSGDIAWHSSGTLWGNEPSGRLSLCPLRFPGQYHDAETGLHYNRYRYYDPSGARYLTEDPLGLALAPNPHAYVANPMSWTDPLGLGPGRGATFEVNSKGEATSVKGKGRPDNQTVFSGHGSYDPANGKVTVPPGTSVTVYAPHGATISDRLGGAIETGTGTGKFPHVATYGPGQKMPNYTLHPPYNPTLNIQGHPITVTKDTQLSQLLQPNMGRTHWAACLEQAGHPLQNTMIDLTP
ncbi:MULTISPECIES: putative adhesin [Actinomadura]|uniref:Adhesin n=1 Tax=Actinomadura yumaensis TaxID=111807 RepID=A0ABW2CMV5_9ACTN|nr:DUF6531 domain-containing protein [Actinomadura sp. J1-007]